MGKVYVNEALENIRTKMKLNKNNIANDSKRLYTIAVKNKVGNKIMASVPLYLIYIDDTYQRTETFSKAKANEIATNFIEAAYDPIKLNYRDGRFYCPAGQHRIYAHIIMGADCIEAELFQESYENEINIFLTQDDNRSKLSPYDRYKAGLACGRYEDVTLYKICKKYNVTIGTKADNKTSKIGSITTAKGILNQYGEECLEWIFTIIRDSGWTMQKRAYDSRTFRALKSVYKMTYGKDVKQKIIKFLENTTPMLLYANAVTTFPTNDPERAMTSLLLQAVEEKGKISLMKAN